MKKVISVLLSMILCLGVISPLAISAESGNGLSEHQANLLILADIVEKQDLTEEFLSGSVSRAQFVLYASHALNIAEGEYVTENYYTDMKGHWASGVVNTFAALGHLSVGEDKLFNPDNAILPTEAVKIVMSILGYGEVANYNGGFPYGYYKVANRIKLTCPNANRTLKADAALALLADSLECAIYDTQIYSDTEPYLTSEEGLTFLSEYHKKYYAEGRVDAADTISLTDASCEAGYIVISGDKYALPDTYNAEDFLGLNVEGYYTEGSENSDKRIELLEISKDNEYYDFSIDELLSVESGYVMNILENGADKEKEYKLKRDLTLIINGVLETTEIQTKLNSLIDGYIRIVDTDDNGVYDYCIVKNYYPFVLNTSVFEGVIFDKISGEKIDLDDYEYYSIVDIGGKRLDMGALREEVLVSVAKGSATNSYVELLISDDEAMGMVEESKERDGDTYVIIDGREYKLTGSYFDKHPIDVGFSGIFKIDAFGNIVYFTEEGVSGAKYGLLAGVALDDGFSPKMKLKIFTATRETKILEPSSKLTIDGTVYREMDKAYDALLNNATGRVDLQVVRYTLDSNNYVDMLDTTKADKDGNEYTAFRKELALPHNISSPDIRFFDAKDGKRVGMNGFTTQSTAMFCVGVSREVAEKGLYTEEDLSVIEYDQIINGQTVSEGNAEIYYDKKPAVAAKALLMYDYAFGKGNYYYTNNVFVVTNVREVLDPEGDIRTAIEGFDGRYKTLDEYYLNDSVNVKVEKGDTVWLMLDNHGDVNEVKMVYDLSQGGDAMSQVDEKGNTYWNTNNNFYQNGTAISQSTVSFMYASAVDGSFVSGFYDYEASPYESNEAFDSNYSAIIYVGKGAKDEPQVRIGDRQDIKEACTVGKENCSKLLLNYVGGNIRCCVVYD